MKVLSEEQLKDALPWADLIEALRNSFNDPVTSPVRHIHEIDLDGGDSASLLVMPAWRSEDAIGVKLVTLYPRNSARGIPGISGLYVLFDGEDGRALAAVEGGELTARRTAAASALAGDYLARTDASRLLMVGTGRLCLNVPQAYRAIRPVEEVLVWGRRPDQAALRARDLTVMGFRARPVDSIAEGLAGADIVTSATNSTEPLILGEDLHPGIHVDLIGAFKPAMRETDDAVMQRADLIIADTFEGVFEEAGDVLQAIASGAMTRETVAAELADLCAGRHPGRTGDDEITVFKSCGCALEDLVAARLALAKAS